MNGAGAAAGPGAPSRWFGLLPLLAVACWWPLDPYWQSDDFLALHHAQELPRALGDFSGPQYGATDVWLFYRPLITLSFWLDLQLGGTAPFWAHLSNALAHGLSALLVALLWRRWLPDGRAFAAGLVWAVLPGHLGSLAWAVGRVDSHTAVWLLLALWLALRRGEARARGEPPPAVPLATATALALASKELAFALPPLCLWLGWLQAAGQPWRRRAAHAGWLAAPAWLAFAGYLGLRFWALGRFGGYVEAAYAPLPILQGLATSSLNTMAPLRWVAPAELHDLPWLPWLGTAPAALAAALLLRQHRARAAAAAVAFGLACAPLLPFLADAANVHNLRYFYLPSVALAGVLGGQRPVVVVLLLGALLPALVAARTTQLQADRSSAQLHRALLREAADGPPEPLFVQGLPHADPSGLCVQLHFGIDRMLVPPFTTRAHDLRALRPLAELAGVVRLGAEDAAPLPLPEGSTYWFPATDALYRVPPGHTLPDLPLAGDAAGVLDLTTPRLLRLAEQAQQLLADNAPSFGITTPGVRPQAFRVTILTANGYLACLCPDHGFGGADGCLDMLRFLAGGPGRQPLPAVVAFTTPMPTFVGDALVVPTAIDRTPEFPVLVEAGQFDAATQQFRPSHRARRLLRFRFDRGYPGWVRLVQNR